MQPSQGSREPLKNFLKLDNTIIAAIIGAVAVILAALIGGIFLLRSTTSQQTITPTTTIVATVAACAAAPTLTGPADGQTLNSHTVTLTWEAPQGCVPDGYTELYYSHLIQLICL